MERVTGIGGVFVRTPDPERLSAWYAEHLGIDPFDASGGVWQQQAGPTVWAPFPADSDYFPAGQQVMLNLRVADLDAMLAQLRAGGVEVVGDVVEQAGAGRFAQVLDPDGRRVELWQPEG